MKRAITEGAPKCPALLKGKARIEWRRVVKLLTEAGTISALDRAALAIYCQAWARWEGAEAEIAERGTIVKSPNGYPVQNPFLSVSAQAAKQIAGLIRDLGLSPAGRRRRKSSKSNQPAARSQVPPQRRLTIADLQKLAELEGVA